MTVNWSIGSRKKSDDSIQINSIYLLIPNACTGGPRYSREIRSNILDREY
jgi:hypothetical protein